MTLMLALAFLSESLALSMKSNIMAVERVVRIMLFDTEQSY